MIQTKKKKPSSPNLKALARGNRHLLLSFWRVTKYGLASFSRNAWLSVAATAIMIVTLLIITVTMLARNIMVDTMNDIKDKVDMSIYIKQDTSSADIKTITNDLNGMSSIKSVSYISPEQAQNEFVITNSDNPDVLAAVSEATNMFPGIFHIKVVDINDTSELESYVENGPVITKVIDSNRAPSFSSDKRLAIDNIARSIGFAEKAGVSAGVIFIAIASLIIFNTIRMAIFNRREEIYMMKLIGANKSFIRGPFIVEAVLYGVLASLFTVAVAFVVVTLIKDKLMEYGVVIQPTVDLLTSEWPLITLGLVGIGAVIGVVSSALATRKYLKLRS
jgi:cell division transport system permease protein